MASVKNLVDTPANVHEFKKWYEKKFNFNIERYKYYYNSVTQLLRENFLKSQFWNSLSNSLANINDLYLQQKKYTLISKTECPDIYIKSLDSLLIKAYRKNVLNNPNFPEPPDDGWITPDNWFTQINDILRTTIEVKYIDGVEFLLKEIKNIADGSQCIFNYSFEARDVGYYAAHAGAVVELELLDQNWSPHTTRINVEIQVTTELQEIIKSLLHKYYEENRQKHQQKDYKWQWDYKSDEFATNYLGHIVHYVEGMIVEIRDKQQS